MRDIGLFCALYGALLAYLGAEAGVGTCVFAEDWEVGVILEDGDDRVTPLLRSGLV